MPRTPDKPGAQRIPFIIILALLLLLGITSSCQEADYGVAPATPGAGGAPRFSALEGNGAIPGRYIVTFHPGVADPAALGEALARTHGGTVHYTYTQVMQGFALSVPAAALEAIRRNPNVATVEADQVVMPDGSQTSATWGLDRIDQRGLPLNGTYNYETDGAGVTAYIFDTGIRYDHAEFEGRARFGYDAFGGTGADCHGHGTHVAGTVGGRTWGVAKGVTLVAVRVLDCTGYGSYSGMIAGMDWVVRNNHGPAVANFSLGGSVSTSLNSALTNMIAAGIQTGVSAGNDGGDACLKSPASAAAAVTVGATTSADARASYSNFGSCLDIFAPGSGITSAAYSSTTGSTNMSGTSMAAPHVTGVLALLRAQRPDLTSDQLRDWLDALSTRNIVIGANSANANLLYGLTGSTSPPPADTTAPPPPADTTVIGTPPAAPAGLKANVVAKTRVKVAWSDLSTNETGFRVERRTGASSWAQVAALGANTTNFTDDTTQPGVTYTYRAYAYNSAGNSSPSNEFTITVGASTTRK